MYLVDIFSAQSTEIFLCKFKISDNTHRHFHLKVFDRPLELRDESRFLRSLLTYWRHGELFILFLRAFITRSEKNHQTPPYNLKYDFDQSQFPTANWKILEETHALLSSSYWTPPPPPSPVSLRFACCTSTRRRKTKELERREEVGAIRRQQKAWTSYIFPSTPQNADPQPPPLPLYAREGRQK